MQLLFANNAQSTLAGSISDSAVTLNLQSGGGAEFPNPTPTEEYFVATITDAPTGLINEIVHVTERTGDTLTVIRGREGTTPLAWAANSLFDNMLSAGQMAAMVQDTQAQAQSWNWGDDIGSANAYQCALDPALTVHTKGMPIRLFVANTNTGASTFNPGPGAKNVRRRDGSALIGNEMLAGSEVTLIYQGTYYILQQPAGATAAAILAGTDTQSYTTPAQLAAAVGTVKLLSGQCYFQYTSATVCTLVPFNGNQVPNAGTMLSLPAAGITVANTGITLNGVSSSNLGNNANYLVALNSSGQLEFWTLATGHSVSATAGNLGVEIITGQNTKTLVGMVRTDGSGQFVNTAGSLFVLSWFNRKKQVSKTNFTGNPALSADAAPAELSSSIRNSFLVWAGDPVDFRNAGSVTCINSNQYGMTGIGFDGTTAELEAAMFAGMNTSTEGGSHYGSTGFSGEKAGLSEGNHYATLLGSTYNFSGNNAVWQGGTTTFSGVGPARPPNTLSIIVMG